MIDHGAPHAVPGCDSPFGLLPENIIPEEPAGVRRGFVVPAGGILPALADVGLLLVVIPERDHGAMTGLACGTGGNAQSDMGTCRNVAHRAAYPSVLEHHLDGSVSEGVRTNPAGRLHVELLGHPADVLAVGLENALVPKSDPALLALAQRLAVRHQYGHQRPGSGQREAGPLALLLQLFGKLIFIIPDHVGDPLPHGGKRIALFRHEPLLFIGGLEQFPGGVDLRVHLPANHFTRLPVDDLLAAVDGHVKAFRLHIRVELVLQVCRSDHVGGIERACRHLLAGGGHGFDRRRNGYSVFIILQLGQFLVAVVDHIPLDRVLIQKIDDVVVHVQLASGIFGIHRHTRITADLQFERRTQGHIRLIPHLGRNHGRRQGELPVFFEVLATDIHADGEKMRQHILRF